MGGASLHGYRCSYPSMDHETCNTVRTLVRIMPRFLAYRTWARRPETLTIFCRDLLHDFDHQIALGKQLFEAPILLIQAPELDDVVYLHAAVLVTSQISVCSEILCCACEQ